MLINHKKIFECFSYFWKVLCFYKKIVKNFKKLCCPVLVTQSWVEPVACLSCESITEIFCDSLASKCFSREKDLEYFSKFWDFMFFATQVGELFVGGRSNHKGYTDIFATQFMTLSRVELPIAENT